MKLYRKPVVHITFWDHTSGGIEYAKPYYCEVFGVLYEEDELAYYVASWVSERNLKDSNNEVYTILKSCVIKKRILK